ncbi:MAG: RsmB/NOP family class I SAM-dependent RNA methyltransferase [Bacteriovoracaceae bacterium]
MNQLPPLFLERLEKILAAQHFEQVKQTFYQERLVSFRLNSLKNPSPEIVQELQKVFTLTNVPWMKDAFLVQASERDKLTHSPYFKDGTIYIQNLSSMLPPLILNPTKFDRVLDLTAAPGSKTSLMSSLMGNEGEIAAVEISRDRFFRMVQNLKTLGVTNVKTFLKDGERVWKSTPELFDKVLIDAPCSTESRFYIDDPETYAYWGMKKIKEMVKKQSRLLFSAVQSLKVGGTLVYSTCSFAPEENEEVLDRILKKFEGKIILEDFEIPLANATPGLVEFSNKTYSPMLSRSKRILPDHAMEGFFLSKIKKVSSTLDLSDSNSY